MTVEISSLPNGMRIVTETMPHLETVSLGVWIGTGSRNERIDENGISHLLEHMAFKGTAQRSAREIAEAIENVGGDINAATSLETTAYYARVLKDDVGLAIGVLADILQNSTFDADELDREKDVIYQEIAACLDTPDDLVFDAAQNAAFANQSAGRSILGTHDTLSRFDRQSLCGYLKRQYVPSRMVVSAAGAVTHGDVVAEVERYFSDLPWAPETVAEPARFVGGTEMLDRPIEQTHLVLAYSAPRLGSKSYYAAQVFTGLFGGGMSSRLFQRVREERGLCYNVYAYCWAMSDTGLFGIYAGTSPEAVEEMYDVIRGELLNLANEGPTQAELERAKAQMKSGLLMGLESSGVRAEQMARHLLAYGHVVPASVLTSSIDAVEKDAIRAFAGTLVAAECPVWAEVGPARAAASGRSRRYGERQGIAAIV